MSSEAVERAKQFIGKNKRSALILLLLILGLFMLLFSSSVFLDEDGEASAEDLSEYKERLERELEDICSSVNGVGRCRVTVTFERGEEHVYKGSVLIESKPPRVMGVTVVCAGADSDKVRSEIVNMMCALFDIGSNRVSVLKLNS